MATTTTAMTGLFLASYEIGTFVPGAPLLTVHFTVNTPQTIVTGFGNITQTTNPPLDVNCKFDGDFTYMTVMPDQVHILVTAKGYPVTQFPVVGGIGPVLQPISDLKMVLESDWKTGTATFTFTDNNGNCHTVQNAPVKAIAPTVLK